MAIVAKLVSALMATAVAAVVTGANYLIWIAWDEENPMALGWWQVAGFVLVLGGVAYIFGRQRHHWAIALGSAPVMFALLYYRSGPREQMWFAATALMAVLTFAGTLTVAGVTAAERRNRARPEYQARR